MNTRSAVRCLSFAVLVLVAISPRDLRGQSGALTVSGTNDSASLQSRKLIFSGPLTQAVVLQVDSEAALRLDTKGLAGFELVSDSDDDDNGTFIVLRIKNDGLLSSDQRGWYPGDDAMVERQPPTRDR